jgi:hypothetical protein
MANLTNDWMMVSLSSNVKLDSQGPGDLVRSMSPFSNVCFIVCQSFERRSFHKTDIRSKFEVGCREKII